MGIELFSERGEVQKVEVGKKELSFAEKGLISSTSRRGSRGNHVGQLQRALKALHYEVGKPDGVYGQMTELAVANFQREQGLIDDGIFGPKTMMRLNGLLQKKNVRDLKLPLPHPEKKKPLKNGGAPFTEEQLKIILDFEVGGGGRYYNRFLRRPTLPPAASGATVGIGVDLRFTTMEDFHDMFMPAVEKGILKKVDYDRLRRLLGYKPTRRQVAEVFDIVIPWEHALWVFMEFTVPKYWRITEQTFPQIGRCKWRCQVALLSLVFNRGGSLKGEKRVYMRQIRDLVPIKAYATIAQCIRDMQRWWPSIAGLRRRRNAEADLVLERYV